MFGTIICIAAVTLGVDYGYEPKHDGGLVYIIQIDPASLKSLCDGRPVQSDIPSDVSGLRTIRFQVGDEILPRVALAPEKKPLLDTPTVADTHNATPSPSDVDPHAVQPNELANNPQGKRLVADTANYNDPLESDDAPKANPESSESGNTEQTAPEKPWSLLYGVIALSVGLAAAFIYLAWVHIGMRSRYRMLLAEHLAISQPT